MRIARRKTIQVSRSSVPHQAARRSRARPLGAGVPGRPPRAASGRSAVRNTSSRVGRRASIRVDRDPCPRRARAAGSTSAAPPCGTRPTHAGRRHLRRLGAGQRRRRARRPSPALRPVASTVTVTTSPRHLLLELVGRARRDDRAVVDDQDPVAERVGLVEVVRGEEDRRPASSRSAADVLPQVGPRLRVEPGGRLVEEDQLRARGRGPSRCRAGGAGRRDIALGWRSQSPSRSSSANSCLPARGRLAVLMP